MRVSATAKYLRRSTRKTRLVTQAIIGKPVEEAAALLRFMPQGAAKDVAKVLKSAAANAENNHDLSVDDLVVADAIANEDSDLFFIPLQELRSVIDAYHKLALKILYALCEVLAQRLRETNERYMNIFTIAQWGGSSPNGPIPIP